jgi:hypothetical protein
VENTSVADVQGIQILSSLICISVSLFSQVDEIKIVTVILNHLLKHTTNNGICY